MKLGELVKKWGWRAGPVGVVVAMNLGKRLWPVTKIDWQVLGRVFVGSGMIVAGWALGWYLPDLMMKPEVKGRLPADIAGSLERALWNVVTMGAMAAAGVWMVSSGGSPLASGLVFGLNVRMWRRVMTEGDYKKWYWIVAREVTPTEHKIFKSVYAGLLVFMFWVLIRG